MLSELPQVADWVTADARQRRRRARRMWRAMETDAHISAKKAATEMANRIAIEAAGRIAKPVVGAAVFLDGPLLAGSCGVCRSWFLGGMQ
jgi:hypothetical protein